MATEIDENFRSAALANGTAESEQLRKKQGRLPKLGKRP